MKDRLTKRRLSAIRTATKDPEVSAESPDTREYRVKANKGTKTVTGIAVVVVRLMSVVDAGYLEA